MKKHQQIFQKIKAFLLEQFGEQINEYENGTYLVIGETGVWISSDEMELTVGYGMNHRHYLGEKEFITEAVDDFFNLLTKRKKTTEYYKGKSSYKIKTEIESANGEYSTLSTSMIPIFPFWKKTEKKIEVNEKLLDASGIENEISEIKNYAQQWL
jgi:hypothetical protein